MAFQSYHIPGSFQSMLMLKGIDHKANSDGSFTPLSVGAEHHLLAMGALPTSLVNKNPNGSLVSINGVIVASAGFNYLANPDGSAILNPWTFGTHPAGTVENQLDILTGYEYVPEQTANQVLIGTDNSTGQPVWSLSNNLKIGYFSSIVANAPFPTIASWGTAAGTTAPTDAVLTGSGQEFRLEFTTTAAPAGSSAAICTFTHATAFSAAALIALSVSNCSTKALNALMAPLFAAGVGVWSVPDATNSVNGFTLVGPTTALNATTKYSVQIRLNGSPAPA